MIFKTDLSIKECEEAWADLKSKSKQKRFFKSQVELREKAQAAADGGEVEVKYNFCLFIFDIYLFRRKKKRRKNL